MTITKKKKALDFLKNTSYNVNIVPCVVGNEKCSGTAQSDSIVKIWALCSPHPAPLLVQVSSHKNNGPATVECPKGFVIGMGFGITFPKGLPIMPQDIYPCRNGTSRHIQGKPAVQRYQTRMVRRPYGQFVSKVAPLKSIT